MGNGSVVALELKIGVTIAQYGFYGQRDVGKIVDCANGFDQVVKSSEPVSVYFKDCGFLLIPIEICKT